MVNLVNLIFAIICIVLGISMIAAPKKITERPTSKIKSEMGVRICGIILILIGILCFFF